MQLTTKYQPKRLQDFAGLHKHRNILGKLAKAPYESAWLLIGESGTGKTTMALALAEEMKAELHHIPSRQCDLETVDRVCQDCHYVPWNGGWHMVLVDEADQMTKPAQHAFLSKLDATAFPPRTIFVFTANGDKNLEDRFLSRCRVLRFDADTVEAAGLLERVWTSETRAALPDVRAIAVEAAGNIRAALMALEVELMGVSEEPVVVPVTQINPIPPAPVVPKQHAFKNDGRVWGYL